MTYAGTVGPRSVADKLRLADPFPLVLGAHPSISRPHPLTSPSPSFKSFSVLCRVQLSCLGRSCLCPAPSFAHSLLPFGTTHRPLQGKKEPRSPLPGSEHSLRPPLYACYHALDSATHEATRSQHLKHRFIKHPLQLHPCPRTTFRAQCKSPPPTPRHPAAAHSHADPRSSCFTSTSTSPSTYASASACARVPASTPLRTVNSC